MALYNELLLLCPGETFVPGQGAWSNNYKTGVPTPQVAGVPYTVNITVIDSETGLEDPTITDVVFMEFGGDEAYSQEAVPTTTLVAGKGTLSIQFNRGGEECYLYLHDQTNPDTDYSGRGYQSVVMMNRGPFSRLQLLLPGEVPDDGSATGMTGALAGALVPSVGFQATVRAVDAHWNLISTISDTIRVSLNNYGTVGADTNLVAGVVKVDVKAVMAGMAYAVTASDVTDPAKTSHVRTFNTGNPIPVGALGIFTGTPGGAESITFLDRDTGATLGVVATVSPIYNGIARPSGHLFIDSTIFRVMSPSYQSLGSGTAPDPFKAMTTAPTQSAEKFYRTIWDFKYNSGTSGPGHYVAQVQEVDINGVAGRVWTMPPWDPTVPSGGDPDSPYDCLVRSMAVSPDGTVLFWNGSNRNGQANIPSAWLIRRFDLVAGVPMSSLTGMSSYATVFGLPNGDILAMEGYSQGQISVPWQLRVYSQSGALLRTLRTGTSLETYWVWPAHDYVDTHIWIWETIAGAQPTTVRRMDLITGEITTAILSPQTIQTPAPMYVVRVPLGRAYTPPTPPTTPPPILVNSDPCCCGGDSTAASPNAGNLLPAIGPGWTPSCAGFGAVPSEVPLTLMEAWDY